MVPEPDLWRSCRDNLARILQLVGGEARQDQEYYDAARATGRRRAEQGLPLDDLLRSFRMGGRLVWESLVDEARALGTDDDALLDLGTRVWEVVDRSSAQVAAAYHDAERSAVRADEQRRSSVWEGLLTGVGEDPGFAFEAARSLGLPVDGRYDWEQGAYAEQHEVPSCDVLVVEGVGAGAATYDDVITCRVWVKAPRDARLARGLARDGEGMRQHWLSWRIEEDAMFDRERVEQRADLSVDGETGRFAEPPPGS